MDRRPAPESPIDVPPHFAVAFLLASLAGVLTVSPMQLEPLWPLAWIGLAPLFVALRGASGARAFVLGWWMETLMYLLGGYWLVNTMVDFGHIPLPLSLVFFVIVATANGVRMGLFAWWVRLRRQVAAPVVQPSASALRLRGAGFPLPRVFPWYLGFLQYPALPLIQMADLTGIHGVSFILVLCGVGTAAFARSRSTPGKDGRYRTAAVVGCVVLLQLGYGLWRLPQVDEAIERGKTFG